MPNRIVAWIDSRPPRLALALGTLVGIVFSSGIWAGGLGLSHYREKAQAEATYSQLKVLNETIDIINKFGPSPTPPSRSPSMRNNFLELDSHQQIRQKLDELSVFGVRCTN